MTTPLFLLRCVQLGISIRDLDLLTVGLVNDMYIESDNDSENYAQVATQRDFDLFCTVLFVGTRYLIICCVWRIIKEKDANT